MNERKDLALKEIRHRVETATDERQRVKLLVMKRAIETDLMIEPTGEIVDITGDVFSYAFGLLRTEPEFIGDPLAYIAVSPIVDDVRERFARFAERANQALKIDEHQKQACFEFLCAYYGVSG